MVRDKIPLDILAAFYIQSVLAVAYFTSNITIC